MLGDVYPFDGRSIGFSQDFIFVPNGNVGGISIGGGIGWDFGFNDTFDEGQITISDNLGAIRVGASAQPLNRAPSFRDLPGTTDVGFSSQIRVGGNVGLLSSYSVGQTNYIFAFIGGGKEASLGT